MRTIAILFSRGHADSQVAFLLSFFLRSLKNTDHCVLSLNYARVYLYLRFACSIMLHLFVAWLTTNPPIAEWLHLLGEGRTQFSHILSVDNRFSFLFLPHTAHTCTHTIVMLLSLGVRVSPRSLDGLMLPLLLLLLLSISKSMVV